MYKLIPATSDRTEISERVQYIKLLLSHFIGLNGSLTDADPGSLYDGLTAKEIHTN